MTPQSDPGIRLELIAACAGWALNTLHKQRVAGKIPPYDAVIPGPRNPANGWKLSTVRRWNPAVADRCAAHLEILKRYPLTDA